MSLRPCLVLWSLRSGLVQFSRCFLSMISFWILMISLIRSSVVIGMVQLYVVHAGDFGFLIRSTNFSQLCIACLLHSSHGMNLNMSGISSNASYGSLVWMMRLIIHRTIGPQFSLRWNCVEMRVSSWFMFEFNVIMICV